MTFTRRQATATVLATTLLPQAWAQETKRPADIPVETFFSRSNITRVALNPSGTHLAISMAVPDKPRRLGVLDLATMKISLAAGFETLEVGDFHWVNDGRLVFEVARTDKSVLGRPGRYAVDADGRNIKWMTGSWAELVPGPQTGDDIWLQWPLDSSEGAGFMKLVRMNTRTGHPKELEVPPWSVGFLIDEQGEALAALTVRGDKARLQWREGAQWRVVREMDRYFGEAFALVGRGPDGVVYVTARQGRDLRALYTYDPQANQLSAKPVLGLAQFDVLPKLVFGHGKLLGVHVEADATATVWLDPECKALQDKIDALLPATSNHLSLPQRGDSPWALVWAWSDRQPGLALAYHRETGKLTVLGRSRPEIDPALMSEMQFVSYPARDGRRIPAYLTLPRSAQGRRPVPMVVLVHGGPFVRGGTWAWDAEVQFLASRGYAVLQPEFRGSTGFGESHFKAGWKQWGQAMQDDLADGAMWAIAQGIADPRRIAIAGASYGGYAAMMGLAKQADVFACAVNWVGVTDLDLMYGAHWSDQPGVYKKYGMPKVLGDREADAQMLRDNSPVHLARNIRKPVLMAYGKRDERVPIEHGERMRDALDHNSGVEWVVYDKEGHGWYWPETKKDFWSRVERFLDKHLKTAVPPPPAASGSASA